MGLSAPAPKALRENSARCMQFWDLGKGWELWQPLLLPGIIFECEFQAIILK